MSLTKALRVIQGFDTRINMDLGHLNLFIKMLREEYKLEDDQLETLRSRLLADDREFEKVWKQYKNKSLKVRGGVDTFKSTLQDLLN